MPDTQNVRTIITAAANSTYKTVDAIAEYARNKTDDLMSVLLDISVADYCDFNTKNRAFMERLMFLNDNEINVTLNALGTNASYNGDSTAITNEAQAPSYASGRNYTENFAKTVHANEDDGVVSTRKVTSSALRNQSGNLRYKNQNQLYQTTENLFPDDLDAGTFSNKWEPSVVMDSVLYKTKQLFRQNKINTIISRFHTSSISTPNATGDAKSKYGLSHGRNLLTKDAETNNGNYPINGYDNPYCRVWTHHYQYNRLDKRIRPFYQASDDARENTTQTSLYDFHNWKNFKMEEEDMQQGETWGWKSENEGWRLSALNDNGFPNIVPKYLGGGKSNIHTKQCMFSLENLAWQGYDPYSFEKALSWEQRGPFGGRIMWFPPYGISFNETTTARWNNHSFIGRGEDVYTYANTTRQGTLNFMLVVDHPSIIDYVSWDDQNHSKGEDTDLLRFFAGCDSGSSGGGNNGSNSSNGNCLTDRANPTPLTDEYLQIGGETEEIQVTENPKTTPPENDVTDEILISFFVFYPNNYGGYYDSPGDPNSEVEAMAYLLAGKGAQKQTDSNSPNHPKDLPLTFDELYNSDGPGYEMKNGGVDDYEGFDKTGSDGNYILGAAANWMYMSNYTDGTNKWFYRIDGKYEYPKEGSVDYYSNTYDQQLTKQANYCDGANFNLNQTTAEAISTFNVNTSIETVYSFAEVAAALAKTEDVKKKIEENCEDGNYNENNVKELERIFKGEPILDADGNETGEIGENAYEINKIEVVGYANDQGKNPLSELNQKRNEYLALHRAESVVKWLSSFGLSVGLKKTKNTQNTSMDGIEYVSYVKNVVNQNNVSDKNSKLYRSAKATIHCKKTQTKPLSETDQSDENAYVRFAGWEEIVVNGETFYKNSNETDPSKKGRLWTYDEASQTMIFKENAEILDRSNYGSFRKDKGSNDINGTKAGDNSFNKYRYDQEYHFFRLLEKKDPLVFQSLMDKIKYFDPAFHTMTPEGFNMRLTFLNQCTRQGSSLADTSNGSRIAANLAFGRPPFCILRLGDFYYQKIVIENISINYDPLVWDLNTEGIGIQPLIANISISFKFIGGGDLAGAVSRLQNAMSFNYYSNTRLYDNRADRVGYHYDQKTNGAIDHELNEKGNYFYRTKMQK